MKKLPLSNASFRYVEKSFKEWLDILGYAEQTVYYLPLHVREFLHWTEQQGINHLKGIDTLIIKAYYEKLKERSNQRRDGALSANYLNKHIQALKKFTDYLRQAGRIELPAIPIRREAKEHKTITWLTTDQINQLYQVTCHQEHYHHKNLSDTKMEALQSRDRALLTIFYGCGLRRNEGVHLDISDINFDKQLLHVRKGKNRERYVPFNKANGQHLENYLYDHRPLLIADNRQNALFISYRHTRMNGQSLLLRLKLMQFKTDHPELIEKEIGLHTLRHSIATHLLQAGMSLENISKFLGHSSLESTQIYTHLSAVATAKEDLIKKDRDQSYKNIPQYEHTQLHEDE